MCACLGVLVAGTPTYAHARRAAAEVYRFESASVIRSAFQAPVIVRLRKSKLEGRFVPRPAALDRGTAVENSYRNDKPHAALHQVVVVTRLARAGLSESLA